MVLNDRGKMIFRPPYLPQIPEALGTINLFLDDAGYLIDHRQNRVQCIVKARLLLNLLKELILEHQNIRVAIDLDGTYLLLEDTTSVEVPLGGILDGEPGMTLFHSVLLVL